MVEFLIKKKFLSYLYAYIIFRCIYIFYIDLIIFKNIQKPTTTVSKNTLAEL